MSTIERLGGVQATLLADDGIEGFQPFLLGAYRHVMSMRGLPLKIERDDPDAMVLVGPDDYTVSITRHASADDLSQFQAALASPVTALLTPDIQDRVNRHRSHVVLDVRRESSEPLVRAKALLDLVSSNAHEQTSEVVVVLQKQIDAMIELIRTLISFEPASAVYFARSNMLMSLDAFKKFAKPGPSLLTIHPKLFVQDGGADIGSSSVGMYTAGAADFIGREIYIPRSSFAWEDLHHGALEFVRAAIKPGGHIIRDGGVLADKTTLRAFEVAHLEAQPGLPTMGRPLYQLTPRSAAIAADEAETRTERRARPRPEPAANAAPRAAQQPQSFAPTSAPSFMPPPMPRPSTLRTSAPQAQSVQPSPPPPRPATAQAAPPPPAPEPVRPAIQQRPVEIQSLAPRDVLQRAGERPAAGSFARGLQGLAPTKSLFGRK